MKPKILILILAMLIVAMAPVSMATADDYEYETEKPEDREADAYEEGTDAIDEEDWPRAIRIFDSVITMNGRRADGAFYWKAYAEAKAGRRTDALQSIAALQKRYPKSKWIEDAQGLEIEIKNDAGQRVSPDKVNDDHLKLIAIQHLMHSDQERALPLLEKILKGPYSRDMKEKSLFVLSQSSSPRAAEIMAAVARGTAHPTLQHDAIKYLGVSGRRHTKLLEEVYQSSNDIEVKERVLEAFMVSGQRPRLFELARSEKNPQLRATAIRQLGVMGSARELQELYRSETSASVKKTIIESMFVGGSTDVLMEIAKTEPDINLRTTAVRNLGLLGRERTGTYLVSVYQSEKNADMRDAALDGLFVQGNATALVSLAKAEKDPRWKRSIVEKLSVMNSKEATDYLFSFLD